MFSDCSSKGFSNLNFYMGFRKVPLCLRCNSATDKSSFQNRQYNWYKVLPPYKFFDIRLITATVDNPVFLLSGNWCSPNWPCLFFAYLAFLFVLFTCESYLYTLEIILLSVSTIYLISTFLFGMKFLVVSFAGQNG